MLVIKYDCFHIVNKKVTIQTMTPKVKSNHCDCSFTIQTIPYY